MIYPRLLQMQNAAHSTPNALPMNTVPPRWNTTSRTDPEQSALQAILAPPSLSHG